MESSDCFFSDAPHKWHLTGYSGSSFSFRCRVCGKNETKGVSDADKDWLKNRIQQAREKSGAVHELWHDFRENVLAGNSGYELQERADEWLTEHSEATSLTVDDGCFMSAAIYLIPHRNDTHFMGVTAVYVPQSGPPCEWFLYPPHLGLATSTFAKLHEEATKMKTTEVEYERKQRNELLTVAAKYLPVEVPSDAKKHEDG